MNEQSPRQIWKDLPLEQQRALQTTHSAIAKAVPGATEHIMWGMPGFRIGTDYLVCVTGFKKHNSLFPGGGVSTTLHKELEDYVVTKGTIHFEPAKPFPGVLLKKILKARIAEINASYPKASGVVNEYYDTGHLKSTGKLKDGEHHGTWTWFRKDGSVRKLAKFKNGVLLR